MGMERNSQGVMLLLLMMICKCLGQVTEEPLEEEKQEEKIEGTIDPFEKYVRLFEQNRAIQLDAVKSIQTFGSKYEQRYKLVDTLLKQLFKVLGDAKNSLTEVGFIPGDPFPEQQEVREVYSKVLENTAMFGELILRIPDITHSIYDKNKEWEFIIGWSVWFCMESKAFRGNAEKLLNLMSQELGLIPKENDYVNPYKESNIAENIEVSIAKEEEEKKKKKSEKIKKKSKETKEKRKGPRLSGSHTEL